MKARGYWAVCWRPYLPPFTWRPYLPPFTKMQECGHRHRTRSGARACLAESTDGIWSIKRVFHVLESPRVVWNVTYSNDPPAKTRPPSLFPKGD